jgi:lipoyl(octanoyl) transferase
MVLLRHVQRSKYMMECVYWGRIPYAEAWDRQKALFEARVSAKGRGESLPDLLVCCEHSPVYTLGKSGMLENLLVNDERLKAEGVDFFRTDRGGDITFHGPGQLVCYPILDLEHYGLGLKQYIHRLEEAVILFLSGHGITGQRMEGATGVWIDPTVPGRARKICAIGVRSSRFVTMHGLALNLSTDLRYFSYINPCGFADKGVTSLQSETGLECSMEDCVSTFLRILERVLVSSIV